MKHHKQMIPSLPQILKFVNLILLTRSFSVAQVVSYYVFFSDFNFSLIYCKIICEKNCVAKNFHNIFQSCLMTCLNPWAFETQTPFCCVYKYYVFVYKYYELQEC